MAGIDATEVAGHGDGSGLRKIGIATQDAAIVDWPDQPVDPFFNVNTPEDLAASITML